MGHRWEVLLWGRLSAAGMLPGAIGGLLGFGSQASSPGLGPPHRTHELRPGGALLVSGQAWGPASLPFAPPLLLAQGL